MGLLLKCEHVGFGYENQDAVLDVNLEVNEGDYICIVGENGSGKSTLMKGILGLLKPTSGRIEYSEELKKAGIGYLPQQTDAQKDFPATVFEVVISGCLGKRGSRPFYSMKEKKEARANLDRLGIRDLEKSCFRELSGGQKQRVLIARALCATDKLLILDEPTNHLDMRTKDILKEALRKFEGTVIVVSHDRDFLTGLADKVYEFANQHIKEYLGGITDFLAAKKIACFREYEQLHKPKGNGISNDEAEREVSENKLSFEERKQLNKEIRKAEQRVERAEQRVTELESEVVALEKQMAAGVVNDELLKKYGETQKELEEAMTEWEKATEEEEEVKSKR